MAKVYPMVPPGKTRNQDQNFDINAFFSPDVVAAGNGLVSQLRRNAQTEKNEQTVGTNQKS
ncbi:hypothetical protein KEN51_CDS0415 [Pseudomonas phage vB_Pae10145-KEN51]|uniref:PHIKZ030.1 n=6 Tax=Viruses TaxID=10239 RepID=L7T481_BPDPK|nr:hypothetical protein FDJ06_gp335 [Pseudomonas phage SL2]YP_009639888.1 PHIKZ030.1 [Pseudomonas phage phiKZ]ANM44799.1 hypothetical protein KTN4_041 [Pseudomonas phage KTN4]QGK90034.1 hypothetical protein [Pseudomonas phage vB_PA32_GUMS]QJB22678.1 hypothetical protein fnug_35 [Pseudomonas phage fnug]QOV07893.1 hypothetical protein [Pseudomonas phage vB_PaeM_kmuB]QXN68678.1 hypothetical protein [Pseudomonas phage PA7]UNI71841.1 hypothetical protein Churi01_gp317 [Pseudomonas phage Churi01]